MKKRVITRIIAAFLCMIMVLTSVDVSAFVVYAEHANEAEEKAVESADISVTETMTDEEAYAKAKEEAHMNELAQKPMVMSVSGTCVYNQYIGVNAGTDYFSIGTYEGNPNSTTDNNQRLLYGWSGGGTSRMYGYVDNSLFTINPSNTYDGTNNVISGTMTKGDVSITREYRIVKGSSGNADVIEMSVTAVNRGSVSHTMGLRIAMDTMVGSNDSAPFYIPGVGGTTTQRKLTGDAIPQFWQAFNNVSSPTVIAQGTLYKDKAGRPDEVIFGNYGNLCNSSWNPSFSSGSSNGDSAVSVRWNPVTLEPGEKKTFKTWYGIGSMEQDTSSLIGLSVAADKEASINDAGTGYNDITIIGYLNNTSQQTVENITASLNLPSTITLAEGYEADYTIASMAPGETQMVSWVINCEPSEAGDTYAYKISVSADDMNPAEVEDTISVPVLDLVPPVFTTSIRADVYGTAIRLGWFPAVDVNGVEKYNIYRDREFIGETSDDSYMDTGLECGKNYVYEIEAVDVYGNVSPKVEAAFITVAPILEMPSETLYGGNEAVALDFIATYTANSGTGNITVKFRPQDENAEWTELAVEKEILNPRQLLGRVQWDITELTSGNYEFEVIAEDRGGMQVPKTAVFTLDRTAPSCLEDVTAIGMINSIGLSWSMAREYDAEGYRIYRRAHEKQPWLLIASLSGRTTLGYIDTEILNEIEYQYAVTAVDKFNQESEFSNVATATGLNDDEQPVVTSLSPAKNQVLSKKVTFVANATDNVEVEKICFYFSTNGGASWLPFGETTGASGSMTWDTREYDDGVIKVKPVAVDVNGNFSNGNLVYDYYIDNTAPAKVEGLTHASAPTIITLNWSDVPDSDLSHFLVEKMTPPPANDFVEYDIVEDARGINITGLRPNTEYTFRVSAVDKQGNVGEPSEPYTVWTTSDVIAPVITNISPSAGYHNGNITLSMSAEDDYQIASVDVQVSVDSKSWNTVYTKEFQGAYKTGTFSYVLDVTDYADGSLFVRGVAKDKLGNEGDSSASAPYVQYILDRFAPAAPANLKAEASGSAIHVKWDNSVSEDVKGFNLYRAQSADGTYQKIASGLQYINYYDRSIEFDQEYFYKVSAYDNAGNESEYSEVVVGCVPTSTDDEKPVIHSIYPANDSVLGLSNYNVSILATDNFEVDYISVEYGEKGLLGGIKDPVTVILRNENPAADLRGTFEIPLEQFETGTEILVKAVAYDISGNESETVKAGYIVDRTAPGIEELSAKYVDGKVLIQWKGLEEEDLNGYIVYRKEGDGAYSKIGQRARGKVDYEFYDTDLGSGASYQYKVVAIDLVNNKSELESETVETPIQNKIKAAFLSDTVIQVGAECMFDATVSTADLRIVSYQYDFGDGTVSTEVKPIHVYEEVGSYRVTLTVTDIEGNTDSCYQTIYVQERKTLGNLRIKVVDDNGKAMPNTSVYFDMEGANTIKNTDRDGYVEFSTTSGTYKIGSYKDGYLPAAKAVTLVGGSYRELQLVLVEHPIVTGEFEVSRMTLDEIKAAGIDISDPANQQVMKFNLHLTYGEQKKDFDFFVNGNGIIIGGNTFIIPDDDGDRKGTVTVIPVPDPGPGPYPGGGFGGISEDNVIVAIMDVPVQASFLKEFFDVKLHIMNHASEEFALVDNLVHLNVPEGMTIMTEGEIPTADTSFARLNGQQQKTLNWILRGDTAGDYELAADYSSTLEMFNADVNAVFKSENIHVFGTDAVKLHVNINRSIRYQTMYFDLGMENVAGIELYMPSMSVMEAAVQDFLIDVEEGEDPIQHKAVTKLGTRLENNEGYKKYITEDPENLSAGESLYHEYVIYNAISSADTQWLREAVINNLENVGVHNVEVTVTDMDLYEVSGEEDAQQKAEALYGENYSAFQSLYDHENYTYYNHANERNDSFMHGVGEFGHGLADAVFKLDFSHFTNDDKEAFMRNFVGEMMADETVNQQMLMKIDDQYIKAAKKMIDSMDALAKTTLGETEYENQGLGTAFNVLKRQENVNSLANNLKQDGVDDNFGTRLVSMAGTAATAGFIEFVKAKNHPEVGSVSEMAGDILSEGITDAIGTCSDVLGTVADVVQTWNDSIDMANLLMQLKAVEEESKFLLERISHYADESSSTRWMAKEAEKLIKDVEEKCDSQREAFINAFEENLLKYVGGEISKAAIKASAKAVTQLIFGATAATGIGVIYQIVCIVYGIVDNTFGWSKYFEAYDKMLTVMLMSVYMGYSFDSYYAAADYSNALRSLKYLIKTRVIGERAFAEYLNDSDVKEEFLETTGLKSVAAFLAMRTEQIVRNRDKIFQTKASRPNIPEAPSVSFDYKLGLTNESFDSTYEYSLNYGETWQTCAGKIAVEEKTTSQMLYVRKKATSDSLAGNISDTAIAGKPRMSEKAEADYSAGIYTISNLKSGTAYEIYFSENAQYEDVNWTDAVTVVTDSQGAATVSADPCNYVIYRRAAVANAFATTARYTEVQCDVTLSVELDGVGRVEVNGETYTGGTHKKGTVVELKAVYDSTHLFEGWYDEDGNCVSTEDVYAVELQKDTVVMAKFHATAIYQIDVQSEDAAFGTVSGAGEYPAGSMVVVNALSKSGYRFIGWYENDVLRSTSAQYLFVSGGNVSLVAKFEATVEKMNLNVAMEGCEVEYKVGTESGQWTETAEMQAAQNTKVTLKAVPAENYEFVYWVDMNYNKVLSESETYTFNLNSNMNVKAVCNEKLETQRTIVFKTGKNFANIILLQQTVVEGNMVTVPEIPDFSGYKFVGWDTDGDQIVEQAADVKEVSVNQDMEWVAMYAVDITYHIEVENGMIVKAGTKAVNVSSGNYEKATLLTVKADERKDGRCFVGWSKDGGETLLSRNNEYQFYILTDMNLIAIYAEKEIEKLPTLNLAIKTREREAKGNDKLRMGITWESADGYTILERGILRTYSEAAVADLYVGNTNSNVKQHTSQGTSSTGSYTYNLSIGSTSANLSKTVYVVGYLIYKDKAGEIYTVYTDVEALKPITN